jgi:hypothetical protein
MGAGRQLKVRFKKFQARYEDCLPLTREALKNIDTFVSASGKLKLRGYQKEVAQRIINSVVNQLGHSIVVLFPRQSGKNELQAQLEAYLLNLYCITDAEMIKVSPTWKPQTQNAMRRLQRVLENNIFTAERWRKESGYIYRVGLAHMFFLSGSPTSSVVGATANVLLQCDEAQDITIAKWDKDFAPMAASTNATRVFWGTAWTTKTLLAREKRAAEKAQKEDGIKRVFVINADDVANEVPAYGKFVAEQVAKLGRSHPMVKTQYYGEEIDAEGGMFPPERLAMMVGEHEEQHMPAKDRVYAILIDVAGQDEGATLDATALENPTRDSTALTVVEVDLASLADTLVKSPTYRVVSRRVWTGENQVKLYALIRAIIEHWRAKYVVIDATGVGAGLSSFLDKAFPGKVLPFVFSQSSKSKLGWDFLGIIDSGRFKDWQCSPDIFKKDGKLDNRVLFSRQAAYCQYEVVPGPGKVLRWSVPDSFRDPETGQLLHDDLLLSAALVAVLDEQDWAVTGPALVVPRGDPLSEMDGEGF